MIIRPATEQDWPLIYPFYAAVMAEGKTYPFPEGQTLEEARPWWMEEPPGQTVVAVRRRDPGLGENGCQPAGPRVAHSDGVVPG